MDIKIVFAVIASIIGIIAFIPYIRDIFSHKTKPHIYTWLIWIITQGIGVFGMVHGGASWGSLSLTIGLIFVIFIFLCCFKYGTKDITKADKIVLMFAFLAVFVWFQLKQPILSILMISIIDFCGFLPSIRKTYKNPQSETLSAWLLFTVSNTFAILALSEYNFLTLFYILTITIANLIIFAVALIGRRKTANALK